ncbi:hypothetical protein [Natronobacterium texcoconense]|uniref:hypothetical protein n=1 Tax=Natronobacterium texcoconense TaxID=1095778 RepID=UPI000B86FDC0|nr:hypothetical protein [Natronobacterium texcoconense]
MSTRNYQTQTQTQSRSPIDRPQPSETAATSADTRPVTESAPATFSHRNTQRLENLIDEFNASFADSRTSSSTEP